MPQTFVSNFVLSRCQHMSFDRLASDLSSANTTGVAFITCSELGTRIPGIPLHPELPVYVWQNLGACIDDAFVLGPGNISDVIVYGHYPCSLIDIGVKGDGPLVADRFGGLLSTLSSLTKVVREEIQSRFGDRRDEEVLRKATELHILRQLELAMEHPEVLSAVNDNRIRFSAWMQVPGYVRPLTFDGRTQQFV